MKIADRILTIVITATLTSAVWIVFGSTLMEVAGDNQVGQVEAADDVPADATDPGGTNLAPDAASETTSTNGSTSAPTPSEPEPADSGLTIPVTGVSASDLTDSFLDERGEGGSRKHEAIDIMAARGTEVVAATAGTIAKLHNSAAGGNSVYLRTEDRTVIQFYAHLDGYASGLREGQRVRAGQRLGTVGASGNAEDSAPHLHFAIIETTADAEWWEPGNAVNPYPLLSVAAE